MSIYRVALLPAIRYIYHLSIVPIQLLLTLQDKPILYKVLQPLCLYYKFYDPNFPNS